MCVKVSYAGLNTESDLLNAAPSRSVGATNQGKQAPCQGLSPRWSLPWSSKHLPSPPSPCVPVSPRGEPAERPFLHRWGC